MSTNQEEEEWDSSFEKEVPMTITARNTLENYEFGVSVFQGKDFYCVLS